MQVRAGQFAAHVHGCSGVFWPPRRFPAPILDTVDPGQEARHGLCLWLPRFDEIAGSLEGICGQGHSVAPRLTPELIPIEIPAQSPDAAQHFEHVAIVFDFFFRMTQAGENLICLNAFALPRQGRQGLARSHFKEDPILPVGQSIKTFGELHRPAQMRHPVFRTGRLGLGHHLAAAVRCDRDLWRIQSDLLQVGPEPIKDRVQHPGMRRDVDRDALKVDVPALEFCFQRHQSGAGS